MKAKVWVTPSILVGILFVRAQGFVRSQLFHSGEIGSVKFAHREQVAGIKAIGIVFTSGVGCLSLSECSSSIRGVRIQTYGMTLLLALSSRIAYLVWIHSCIRADARDL